MPVIHHISITVELCSSMDSSMRHDYIDKATFRAQCAAYVHVYICMCVDTVLSLTFPKIPRVGVNVVFATCET